MTRIGDPASACPVRPFGGLDRVASCPAFPGTQPQSRRPRFGRAGAGITGEDGFMRTCLLPCVLMAMALGLISGLSWTAKADAGAGDVEYSTGAPSPTPARPPQEAPAAKPDLTIHLDMFDKLPLAKPEPPRPQATTPAPPATPRPAAPPPAAAAVPANPNSPVMAVLRSTLRGDFAGSLDLVRRMPKKTFTQRFDRAMANKYSRQGNELINKKDDPAGAVSAYATAYAYDQSSSEINGSYGYALFLNGRFAEARDKEIESLELAPGYGAAWFTLGQIFGYLKQEDQAYASFVTTCLVTRNLNTTLGFLDREKDKYGEECVQRAAAKALATCRQIAGQAAVSRPAPSAAAAPAQPSPATPSGGRVGMVDVQRIILGSRQFPVLVSKATAMAGTSDQERERRLKVLLVPMLESVRELTRRYARSHGYAVVLEVRQERAFRQGQALRSDQLPFSETSDSVLGFLNSDAGRTYRRTVAIEDLTSAVLAQVNGQ